MIASANPSLFRFQPFRRLFAAQLISSLGDWLDLLALFALVSLKWHATSMEMAFVTLCFGAPFVLFGTVAGVLADRMERRTLMILSDALRVPIVLALVFATSMWHIYALLLLKGTLAALFNPAKNGKLKEIVPEGLMDNAVSYSTMVEQGAKIVGPMLSGALIGIFAVETAFYIDAATFLISAIILLGIPKRIQAEAPSPSGPKPKLRHELREGLLFMKNVPFLVYGMIVFCTVMLILQMVDSQLTVLIRDIPNVTTGFLGVTIAASGLGLLLSATYLSKARGGSVFLKIAFGTIGVGLCFFVSPWIADGQESGWLMPLAFLFGGAFAGFVIIPFQTEAQKRTPVEMSGRVFGTIGSLTTLMTLIGPVAGGLLATMSGIRLAFFFSGGLIVVIGVVTLLFSKTLDRSRTNVSQSVGNSQTESA